MKSPISTHIPSNNNSDEVIVRMSNTGTGIHPKFFQGCLQNSLQRPICQRVSIDAKMLLT